MTIILPVPEIFSYFFIEKSNGIKLAVCYLQSFINLKIKGGNYENRKNQRQPAHPLHFII